MKVLFIYPNVNVQVGFNYGVSHISSLLKNHNIETFLLNINEKLGYNFDLKRIRRDILSIKPNLIGLSVITSQFKYATRIARDIKRYYDVPIIMGGIHPTMNAEDVLLEDSVDVICMGEGEEAVLEFCLRKNPEGIRNLAYKKQGVITYEPLRPYCDITKLPPRDYKIFDFQKMIDAKDGWVGLLSSRGCPFRCTYCLNHRIVELYRKHGSLPKDYMRRHTVDQVLKEIEYVLEHYKNIRMFIFDDDLFTFDRDWLREFSEKYKATTKIGFVCNAHPRMFDEEIASCLKEAGCKIVKFGLESGNERVRREILNRHMSNREIEKAFETAHKAGLHTSAFFMVGLPSEKKAEMLDTISLISKIRPGRFRLSIFFPFKGTKAFDLAQNKNGIDLEKMERLDNFFDDTCLLFDEDEKLLINKLKSCFSLYVNGYMDEPIGKDYRILLEKVEAADSLEWEKSKDMFLRELNRIDERMMDMGMFYRIRYERFMGVRNDWKDDNISA